MAFWLWLALVLGCLAVLFLSVLPRLLARWKGKRNKTVVLDDGTTLDVTFSMGTLSVKLFRDSRLFQIFLRGTVLSIAVHPAVSRRPTGTVRASVKSKSKAEESSVSATASKNWWLRQALTRVLPWVAVNVQGVRVDVVAGDHRLSVQDLGCSATLSTLSDDVISVCLDVGEFKLGLSSGAKAPPRSFCTVRRAEVTTRVSLRLPAARSWWPSGLRGQRMQMAPTYSLLDTAVLLGGAEVDVEWDGLAVDLTPADLHTICAFRDTVSSAHTDQLEEERKSSPPSQPEEVGEEATIPSHMRIRVKSVELRCSNSTSATQDQSAVALELKQLLVEGSAHDRDELNKLPASHSSEQLEQMVRDRTEGIREVFRRVTVFAVRSTLQSMVVKHTYGAKALPTALNVGTVKVSLDVYLAHARASALCVSHGYPDPVLQPPTLLEETVIGQRFELRHVQWGTPKLSPAPQLLVVCQSLEACVTPAMLNCTTDVLSAVRDVVPSGRSKTHAANDVSSLPLPPTLDFGLQVDSAVGRIADGERQLGSLSASEVVVCAECPVDVPSVAYSRPILWRRRMQASFGKLVSAVGSRQSETALGHMDNVKLNVLVACAAPESMRDALSQEDEKESAFANAERVPLEVQHRMHGFLDLLVNTEQEPEFAVCPIDEWTVENVQQWLVSKGAPQSAKAALAANNVNGLIINQSRAQLEVDMGKILPEVKDRAFVLSHIALLKKDFKGSSGVIDAMASAKTVVDQLSRTLEHCRLAASDPSASKPFFLLSLVCKGESSQLRLLPVALDCVKDAKRAFASVKSVEKQNATKSSSHPPSFDVNVDVDLARCQLALPAQSPGKESQTVEVLVDNVQLQATSVPNRVHMVGVTACAVVPVFRVFEVGCEDTDAYKTPLLQLQKVDVCTEVNAHPAAGGSTPPPPVVTVDVHRPSLTWSIPKHMALFQVIEQYKLLAQVLKRTLQPKNSPSPSKQSDSPDASPVITIHGLQAELDLCGESALGRGVVRLACGQMSSQKDPHQWKLGKGTAQMNAQEVLAWDHGTVDVRDGVVEEFDIGVMFGNADVTLAHNFLFGDILDRMLLHWKAFKTWRSLQRQLWYQSARQALGNAARPPEEVKQGPEGLPVGDLVISARKLTVHFVDVPRAVRLRRMRSRRVRPEQLQLQEAYNVTGAASLGVRAASTGDSSDSDSDSDSEDDEDDHTDAQARAAPVPDRSSLGLGARMALRALANKVEQDKTQHNVATLRAEEFALGLELNEHQELAHLDHLVGVVRKMDTCPDAHLPYRLSGANAFAEIWARMLKLKGKNVSLCIRDYTIPLLTARSLRSSGTFGFAQLKCPEPFQKQAEACFVYGAVAGLQADRKDQAAGCDAVSRHPGGTTVSVTRGSAVPAKFYHDLKLFLRKTAVTWGNCWQEALQVFSQAAGRFGTTTPPDAFAGGPLQWWDLLRYKFHGTLGLVVHEFRFRLLCANSLSTPAFSPYTTTCLETCAQLVRVNLRRAKVEFTASKLEIAVVDIPDGAPLTAHMTRGRGVHAFEQSDAEQESEEEPVYPGHHGTLVKVDQFGMLAHITWQCHTNPFAHYVHHFAAEARTKQPRVIVHKPAAPTVEVLDVSSSRVKTRPRRQHLSIDVPSPTPTASTDAPDLTHLHWKRTVMEKYRASGMKLVMKLVLQPSDDSTPSSSSPKAPTAFGPYFTFRYDVLRWLWNLYLLYFDPPAELLGPEPLVTDLGPQKSLGSLLEYIKINVTSSHPCVELLHLQPRAGDDPPAAEPAERTEDEEVKEDAQAEAPAGNMVMGLQAVSEVWTFDCELVCKEVPNVLAAESSPASPNHTPTTPQPRGALQSVSVWSFQNISSEVLALKARILVPDAHTAHETAPSVSRMQSLLQQQKSVHSLRRDSSFVKFSNLGGPKEAWVHNFMDQNGRFISPFKHQMEEKTAGYFFSAKLFTFKTCTTLLEKHHSHGNTEDDAAGDVEPVPEDEPLEQKTSSQGGSKGMGKPAPPFPMTVRMPSTTAHSAVDFLSDMMGGHVDVNTSLEAAPLSDAEIEAAMESRLRTRSVAKLFKSFDPQQAQDASTDTGGAGDTDSSTLKVDRSAPPAPSPRLGLHNVHVHSRRTNSSPGNVDEDQLARWKKVRMQMSTVEQSDLSLVPAIPLTPTGRGIKSPAARDTISASSNDGTSDIGAYRYVIVELKLLWTMPIRREVNQWMDLWWRWWHDDEASAEQAAEQSTQNPSVIPEKESGSSETSSVVSSVSPQALSPAQAPLSAGGSTLDIGSLDLSAHTSPSLSASDAVAPLPGSPGSVGASDDMLRFLEQTDKVGTIETSWAQSTGGGGLSGASPAKIRGKRVGRKSLVGTPSSSSTAYGGHSRSPSRSSKARSVSTAVDDGDPWDDALVRSFVVDFWRPQVNFQSNETNSRLVLAASRARVEGLGFPFLYDISFDSRDDANTAPSPNSSTTSVNHLASPRAGPAAGSPDSGGSPRVRPSTPRERYHARAARKSLVERHHNPQNRVLAEPSRTGYFGINCYKRETTANLVSAMAFVAPIDVDIRARLQWVPQHVFITMERERGTPQSGSTVPSIIRRQSTTGVLSRDSTILRRIVDPCELFFTYTYDVDMTTSIRNQAWAQAQLDLRGLLATQDTGAPPGSTSLRRRNSQEIPMMPRRRSSQFDMAALQQADPEWEAGVRARANLLEKHFRHQLACHDAAAMPTDSETKKFYPTTPGQRAGNAANLDVSDASIAVPSPGKLDESELDELLSKLPPRTLTTATKLFVPSLVANMDGREYHTLINVVYYLLLAATVEEEEEWVVAPPAKAELKRLVEETMPRLSTNRKVSVGNKSPLKHTVEYCISSSTWEMKLEGSKKVFVENHVQGFHGRHDYHDDDSREALFVVNYFDVESRMPNAPFKTLFAPDKARWKLRDRRNDVMLRLRTENAPPGASLDSRLSTVTIWEFFDVSFFPMTIQLPHDHYQMLWNYFFPPQATESTVDALLPAKMKFAGDDKQAKARTKKERKDRDTPMAPLRPLGKDASTGSTQRPVPPARQLRRANSIARISQDPSSGSAAEVADDSTDLALVAEHPSRLVLKKEVVFSHYFKYCRIGDLSFTVSYRGGMVEVDCVHFLVHAFSYNHDHVTWSELFSKAQSRIVNTVVRAVGKNLLGKKQTKRPEEDSQSVLDRYIKKGWKKKSPTTDDSQPPDQQDLDSAKAFMLFGKRTQPHS